MTGAEAAAEVASTTTQGVIRAALAGAVATVVGALAVPLVSQRVFDRLQSGWDGSTPIEPVLVRAVVLSVLAAAVVGAIAGRLVLIGIPGATPVALGGALALVGAAASVVPDLPVAMSVVVALLVAVVSWVALWLLVHRVRSRLLAALLALVVGAAIAVGVDALTSRAGGGFSVHGCTSFSSSDGTSSSTC